jgi:hypothetical protein
MNIRAGGPPLLMGCEARLQMSSCIELGRSREY